MITFLDKLFFIKHFSVLIKAGVPLLEGLKILASETRSSAFRKVLRRVSKSVEEGESLASSMSRFKRVFSPLTLSVIAASEQAGTLEENLNYLADQMTKDNDMRRKVQSALAYPAIVLVATAALGIMLATFVFPKIIPVFKGLKVELPFVTRILLGTFSFFEKNALLVVLGIILAVFLIIILSRIRAVKPLFETLGRRSPILGKLTSDVHLARFSRTLGTLLKAGVPILESLGITKVVIGGVLYQKSLDRIIQEVLRGGSFSEALRREHESFPLLTSSMYGIGEKSGTLEESASYLAEFYEGEVDTTTKNLATIIEPVLLIFIGVMVGVVAVSIILPMYQILGKIR